MSDMPSLMEVVVPPSPGAMRPESNDATMGSSAGSSIASMLDHTVTHAEQSPPVLLPGTAAKRERSEGGSEMPSPHGWRRTHEAALPHSSADFMLPNAALRRPPSYSDSRALLQSPTSSPLEAELRKEVALLSQSYRELQHMYGEKCGEVVVLRRRLEEALGGGGSSFPRRVEGFLPTKGGAPQGGRRDADAESSASMAPSSSAATTAAKLCCELCDVYVTSERSLLYHKEGERHRKRVARLLQDNALRSSPSPN
jgi:hypothetical protein